MREGAAHFVRDIGASLFVLVYVPLLCAFAVQLTVAPQGVGRVLTFLLCVIASDVGGYAAGVVAGGSSSSSTASRSVVTAGRLGADADQAGGGCGGKHDLVEAAPRRAAAFAARFADVEGSAPGGGHSS